MKTNLTEATLIRGIRDRDPAAASALYDQYAITLFKIICCHTKDPDIANLLLQQTFLQVWKHVELYELQDSRWLLWMAGIARSLAKSAQLELLPFEASQLAADSKALIDIPGS